MRFTVRRPLAKGRRARALRAAPDHTEAASSEQLCQCLDFVLAACGNANLMPPTLKHTLCDHAASNYRVLTLADELLYFTVFEPPAAMPKPAGSTR